MQTAIICEHATKAISQERPLTDVPLAEAPLGSAYDEFTVYVA